VHFVGFYYILKKKSRCLNYQSVIFSCQHSFLRFFINPYFFMFLGVILTSLLSYSFFILPFILIFFPYLLLSKIYSFILSLRDSLQSQNASAYVPITPHNHYFAHCQRFVINQSKFESWQHF
jgi:hypothetical protein